MSESMPDPDMARMDLAGLWQVKLDRVDEGEDGRWYGHDLSANPTSDTMRLPGSLQQQGIGDDIEPDTPWVGLIVDRSFFTDERYAPYREAGRVQIPFWLQPEKYYQGAAWLQRSVDIPAGWDGRAVVLTLERVHWETTVWVDNRRIGSERSLTTPHRFELGELGPGRHRLTIRVDNRMIVNVGPNAHSVSDHTQGNWNGIIGNLALEAVSAVAIRNITVFPNVSSRSVRVKINITGDAAGAGVGNVSVSARRFNVPGEQQPPAVSADFDFVYAGGLLERGIASGGGHVDLDLPLGADAETWDEFHPALYELTVRLVSTAQDQNHRHTCRTTFGLREVGVDGTQISVNGRKTFIRGTLESCIFPLTGYPPTDVDAWRRIIGICKSHGLNLLRFHSWCPPEAAFIAADESGFYFQVEGPVWANHGAALGESRPLDAFLYEECWRIATAYGNHPSFLMMAHGNEPAGRDAEFLAGWVHYWRKWDPRRLYTSGAGWPSIEENDYDNVPQPRIQHWGEGLASRINAQPPETVTDYSQDVARCPRPIVSHEIGQWCAYPNFAEVEKYMGLMKPKNFAIFADFLRFAGMADQAADFLIASGKLQVLCYKEEIESALRTPGFGGFHLLDLHDFPGQGTAPVGVLDPFWDEKGYVSAEEFARFCGPTVPLARLPKRSWHSDEVLTADVQVAHFGPAALEATISWQLVGQHGKPLAGGELPQTTIAIGNDDRHGSLRVPLQGIQEAQQISLVVTVQSSLGARFENDWDLWVYPRLPPAPEPSDVTVTGQLEHALRQSQAGGSVLLLADLATVKTDVELGFSPVFWNTAWTRNQAPHTLGILCDPAHRVFDRFPTDSHTNWQWWELIHDAKAMVLDGLPQTVRPLVQPIDTWFEARRLGLLVEARVGSGRLMICSMDLASNLDMRPVARQFRHSLLNYLASPDFAPTAKLEPAHVQQLFASQSRGENQPGLVR